MYDTIHKKLSQHLSETCYTLKNYQYFSLALQGVRGFDFGQVSPKITYFFLFSLLKFVYGVLSNEHFDTIVVYHLQQVSGNPVGN